MSFPDRFQLAYYVASILALQSCPFALAQNAVLTGSLHQDTYRPRILAQDQLPSQVPVTSVRIPAVQNARVVYIERPVVREVYVRDNRTFFQRHPKVKAASIGAGVGAGVGAVTGLITHQGLMRGAVIGAGTGAGVGLLRSSSTLKRHPIVRNLATGSLIGLGIGGAASHGHRRLLAGAGIGAALGLGASLLNGEFK